MKTMNRVAWPVAWLFSLVLVATAQANYGQVTYDNLAAGMWTAIVKSEGVDARGGEQSEWIIEPANRLIREELERIEQATARGGEQSEWIIEPANRLIREELERIEQATARGGEQSEWIIEPANRLIREELERIEQANRLIREELWMAPHAGEEWSLDPQGRVRIAYRLVAEGADSYFELVDESAINVPPRVSSWRRALQWVSHEPPRRYGAFLLADRLSAPETLWVGLPWQGQSVAMVGKKPPSSIAEAFNLAGVASNGELAAPREALTDFASTGKKLAGQAKLINYGPVRNSASETLYAGEAWFHSGMEDISRRAQGMSPSVIAGLETWVDMVDVMNAQFGAWGAQ